MFEFLKALDSGVSKGVLVNVLKKLYDNVGVKLPSNEEKTDEVIAVSYPSPAPLSEALETSVSIRFAASNAGYKNSLGHYTIDSEGVMHSVALDFANVKSLKSGQESSFTMAEGHAVGVFIVADGYNANKGFSNIDLSQGDLSFLYKAGQSGERPATIHDNAKDVSLVFTDFSGKTTVIKGNVYHSLLDGEVNNLNIDTIDHAQTNTVVDGETATTRVGFEDLKGGGDKDFNDVIFDVIVTKPDPVIINHDPVAYDDEFFGQEDVALSGNVLVNDNDVEGDEITVTAATLTSEFGGTVVIDTDGTFTYTPATNFYGVDSFSYTLNAANGAYATGSAILTIANVDIIGTVGDDVLSSIHAHEELFGLAGNDTFLIGHGHDYIDGGAGADTISFAEAGFAADVDLRYMQYHNFDGTISSAISVENVTGSQFADLIRASGGNNQVHAGAGDDVVYSYNGHDVVYGEDGDDQLFGNQGNDTLYGGSGNDTLYGQEDNDTLYGEAGDDKLYGNEGDDTLFGGDGNDLLYGDLIYSTDVATGNDKLYGGNGNDTLLGHDGNDYLEGGAGLDALYGGNGDDVLIGGADKDTLYGEAGHDTFAFLSIDGSIDVIADFTLTGANSDVINISNLLSGYQAGVSDLNNFVDFVYRGADRTDIRVNADGQGNDWTYIAIVRGADFSGLADDVNSLLASGNLVADTLI